MKDSELYPYILEIIGHLEVFILRGLDKKELDDNWGEYLGCLRAFKKIIIEPLLHRLKEEKALTDDLIPQ